MSTKQDLLKKLLFVPCTSKADLQRWIRVYLGIDFPDATVSLESNSNPMDLIWEVYSKCLANDDEDFSRVMAYATRGGFKTLGASVLEVLGVLHLRRSVGHMAATGEQAGRSQEYVRDFMARPMIKDYKSSENKTRIEVLRFEHKTTKHNLTEKEHSALPESEKQDYTRIGNFIQIVICTLQGANGLHSELFCVDGDTEVLVPSKAEGRTRKPVKIRSLWAKESGSGYGGRKSLKIAEDKVIENPSFEVISYDFNTGSMVTKKPLRIHRTSKPSLEIKTSTKNITVSEDHPLFVLGRGFVSAKELKLGDILVGIDKRKTSTKAKMLAGRTIPEYANQQSENVDEWHQIVLGSLLGDGSIAKKEHNNPYFYENHSPKQAEYLNWKRQIVGRKLKTRSVATKSGFTGADMVGFATGNSALLSPYVGFKKSPTYEMAKTLTALGLAVWFMDDGSSAGGRGFRLHTESFDEATQEMLVRVLDENFGIKMTVRSYKKYKYLSGDSVAFERLVSLCLPYAHPELAYKFKVKLVNKTCRFCGLGFMPRNNGKSTVTCTSSVCRNLQSGGLLAEPIQCIQSVGIRQVYCFTLPDTHTFWGNGLLNRQCVDEIDTIDGERVRGYRESKNIPKARDGLIPITLLTSTRKFSYGLVQQELDAASLKDTGLKIRHWNVVDILERCPPTRHKPSEPKVDLYVNDDTLEVLNDLDFSSLDDKTQESFAKVSAFAGCVKCSIFSACKTRLATHQTSTSKMLTPISEMIPKFREQSVEDIQTQLLCRKPSGAGLVYSRFSKEIHMKTATEIMAMVTGEPVTKKITKQALLDFLVEKEARFRSGLDFGFTHPFCVVTGAIWGNFCFVIDVISQTGLELTGKMQVCQRLKQYGTIIFADPEDPSSVEDFRKTGKFNMRKWDKGKGSVKRGIEAVRAKLKPASGEPTLFFLKDDPGCELLASRIEKYHFETDLAGNVSETPAKVDDDELDAMRYMVMNSFTTKGMFLADVGEGVIEGRKSTQLVGATPTWQPPSLHDQMQSIVNEIASDGSSEEVHENPKDRHKSRIVWDI